MNAPTTEEIDRAFTIIARERADACISLADPFFSARRRQIVELAGKHWLPAMYGRTAQALGLKIPQELLLRADDVIE